MISKSRAAAVIVYFTLPKPQNLNNAIAASNSATLLVNAIKQTIRQADL